MRSRCTSLQRILHSLPMPIPSTSGILHHMSRRSERERNVAPPEVGPLTDVMIAAATLAALAFIAVMLERSERLR